MSSTLAISLGQCSDKGRKPENQDFHGALIPNPPLLASKGIAIALADGISSSEVSHEASESAVKGFLTDYYCTSDAWSVKTAVQRVLAATNSWLHAQTRRSCFRYERDRGYVCTFSAMVLKSRTAHLFHVGDSRIYRLAGGSLEQLTEDHRVVVSSRQSYLGRALGAAPHLEIDHQALPVNVGDVFVLATDGVCDHLPEAEMAALIACHGDDLNRAARSLVDEALARGSEDNLTVQVVRVDRLPPPEAAEILLQGVELQPPPLLEARAEVDGYRILRTLHGNARSHIYLAEDTENHALVALKIPSIDRRGDTAYLRRFMMEEWVARRINNAHVLKAHPDPRARTCLYVVMEYVEGQTLAQWMIDNPRPELGAVRGIVDQISRGLQAFHRMEMVHQDIRPQNIMIDAAGTVKIIDFGATRVAGVAEAGLDYTAILGTAQYTAPEYFLGEAGTARSDLFSLGVLAYQMLSGRLPYGAQVAKATTRRAQARLRYHPILTDDRQLPHWVDAVIRKAVHSDPYQRQEDVIEFAHALRSARGEGEQPPSLMERNPLLFWKVLCAILAVANLVQLARR